VPKLEILTVFCCLAIRYILPVNWSVFFIVVDELVVFLWLVLTSLLARWMHGYTVSGGGGWLRGASLAGLLHLVQSVCIQGAINENRVFISRRSLAVECVTLRCVQCSSEVSTDCMDTAAGVCHLSADTVTVHAAAGFEYRELITRPSTTDVTDLIGLSPVPSLRYQLTRTMHGPCMP